MLNLHFILWGLWFALVASSAVLAPRRPQANACYPILVLASLLQSLLAAWGILWGGDPQGSLLTLLIAFLVGVVATYSKNYLAGNPRQGHFFGWLSAAWICVSQLAQAQHLLLLGLAWTGASLCLHQLIALDPRRSRALAAARSKFRLARLADCLLMVCLALLLEAFHTLDLHQIQVQLASRAHLSGSLHLAACLLVMVAIIKTGQIPFHGWLVQVMEAPTPVSALLHAGIVNIGGFMLIRMGALLDMSEPARLLLVGWGGATALLACLVAGSRSSLKVSLAWSTCAQMGFMLGECGLGAYTLATLHLLAHSLYKAYCFLNAGDQVLRYRRKELVGNSPWLPSNPLLWLGPLIFCGGATLAYPDLGAWSIGLLPLWLRSVSNIRWLLGGILIAALYATEHWLFAALVPSSPASQACQLLAGAYLVLLLGIQATLSLWPQGRPARWLGQRILGAHPLSGWFHRNRKES